jgi:ribonuclease HI
MAQKFYAYYLVDANESGITEAWNECERITKGNKARYKSFKTFVEAEKWLSNGAEYETKKGSMSKKDDLAEKYLQLEKGAIYFDAGTGRGNGVEVRVTDYDGSPLLQEIIGYAKVNEHGNYYLADNRTNNFGELVGIYAALKYAIKNKIMIICGDSSLVIDYWSNGRYNKSNLTDQDTIELIRKVKELREEFQKQGGKVKHVSGDVNPADLGFHK